MNRLVFLITSAIVLLFSCNSKDSQSEQRKLGISSFYKAIENNDWASIDKFIAADAVDHAGSTGDLKGLEAIKKELESIKTAYPDMKFEIMSVAGEGDIYFCWVKATGTQTGLFMGSPPSNQRTTITSVDVIRFKGEKAVEHWGYMNMSEAMKAFTAGVEPTGTLPSDSNIVSDTAH
jgi:predicted ester cyclase